MATHTGKDGAVYVGANAVAEVRDWSVEQTSEVVADTVMGDDWVTNKQTLSSWTASLNCYWDETDSTGQEALTVGAEVTLNLYPEGNTTGDAYYTGSAIVTSISVSLAFDGMVERSISATGNGALTSTTVSP